MKRYHTALITRHSWFDSKPCNHSRYLATRCDLIGISPLTRRAWRIIRPFPLSLRSPSRFPFADGRIYRKPDFPSKIGRYITGLIAHSRFASTEPKLIIPMPFLKRLGAQCSSLLKREKTKSEKYISPRSESVKARSAGGMERAGLSKTLAGT